jgi:hypothetical protein
MAFINHTLGTDEGGWIPTEEYDQAVAANEAMRESAAQSMAESEGVEVNEVRDTWPYKGPV